jgi:hypothetical protein
VIKEVLRKRVFTKKSPESMKTQKNNKTTFTKVLIKKIRLKIHKKYLKSPKLAKK